MAAYPLSDWRDLVPGEWYELRVDDETFRIAQCTGPYDEVLGSAPFHVKDGGEERFYSNNWTATRISNRPSV